MRNRYDWRLRVMDEVAEPVPSGTRMTIYRKRNPWRLPILLGSMFAAWIVSCVLVAHGQWLPALIPHLWPTTVVFANLIGLFRG